MKVFEIRIEIEDQENLRVQGFMIYPKSIGVLKEIKLGCHDGKLGESFI